MTQQDRTDFIVAFFKDHCVRVLETKGKEYSQHQIDVNSNFKRLGAELDLDPKKILFVYLKKHWDAILAYLKSGKVESEPIESRIGDCINYLFILASLIEEEQKSLDPMP